MPVGHVSQSESSFVLRFRLTCSSSVAVSQLPNGLQVPPAEPEWIRICICAFVSVLQRKHVNKSTQVTTQSLRPPD